MKTFFPYIQEMTTHGLASVQGFRVDTDPSMHVWTKKSPVLTREILKTHFIESFPAILDLDSYVLGQSDHVPTEKTMFPNHLRKQIEGPWDGFGFVHLTARGQSPFLISQRGFVFCTRLTLHHAPSRTTIDSHIPLTTQDLDKAFPRDLEKLKLHMEQHGIPWQKSVVTLLKGRPLFKCKNATETDFSIALVVETLRRSGLECHQVIECHDDDQPFLLDTLTGLQKVDVNNLSAVYQKILRKLRELFDRSLRILENLKHGQSEDTWQSQTILEIAEHLINKINRTQINLDFFPEENEPRWEALKLTLLQLREHEHQLLQSLSLEELTNNLSLLEE